MRTSFWSIALIAALLASTPASAAPTLYRIGTVSGQLSAVSAESFRPFTDYLSSRIPDTRFEMVLLPTIEALFKAADERQLSFAFSTPVALVELNERHRLRPLATVTQRVGEGTFPWLAGAVFVKRSRSDLQRLDDVRGQRVIALSAMALGDWLSAVREWRHLGIDEALDPQSVRFVSSYSNVVAEVCNGTADMGVLSASTLADVARECADGLRVLPAPTGARDPRYPIDVSTMLYPEAAFAAIGDVDEQLVTRVAVELLSIEQGSAVAKAAAVAGFTAPLSYTSVQQLMEELRVGPYKTFGLLTFSQALQQHAGKVFLVLLMFFIIVLLALIRTRRLNAQLATTIGDLTRGERERAQLESQLQQSRRMDSIGRLAGAVAHDFNNLLTVINGYCHLMLAAGTDHDTGRNLRQIHKAGTRAAELTQQLLTFSKQQISRPVPLDLNVIIRDSEAMFRRLVGEDVHLVINTMPSLWLVMAETSQMHQVLMNLLLNARDAMPNGGTLTIQTSNASLDQHEVARADVPAGPYVAMVVSDTGVGMDEPTQQQIFEPFFTTKGVAGTGLGLSTVYGIVRQNGGTITVQSERNRGTTFAIYLPRTEQRLESQHVFETASAQSVDGVRTILVVEDQDDVRGFAMDVLAASGYQVLAAPSGDAALEVATAHRAAIDLLLTDVVLRGMNGRELSTRFLALHPESRVLFTSGYTDDILAQRGVLAASIAFLPKPYSPDGLRAKVRETLSYERSA